MNREKKMSNLILAALSQCPGPYFRQLSKELAMPVGTLNYYLTKLARERLVYRLGSRPRYYHVNTPLEEAIAIYILREGPKALREFPEVKCGNSLSPTAKSLMTAALDRYPCLRQDVVENYILWPTRRWCS
ncbi:MAG: transcriptional regulator [Pyrobaculum sp.]